MTNIMGKERNPKASEGTQSGHCMGFSYLKSNLLFHPRQELVPSDQLRMLISFF